MCLFKEFHLSALVSVGAELITVKPLHNGHLEERRKWQLWIVIRLKFFYEVHSDVIPVINNI